MNLNKKAALFLPLVFFILIHGVGAGPAEGLSFQTGGWA